MFLIELTKPLDEINHLMKAHVQFLKSGFRAGVFIAAGRQQPRVGGIILACACGRAKLDALMAVDPFVESGAASYRMVEFRSSLHHADFSVFADPGTRPVGKKSD